MSRETKSNGRKDKLDRFYTSVENAKQCLSFLNLNEYDCIIEPSAGCGNFSKMIPNCYAYDIAPQDSSIIEADWFKLDKNQFADYSNILVCGNPPFGEQNTLAIKFFNEAARFCNTIAFILPLSFKKTSIQNKLDLNFVLFKEYDLPDCLFLLQNKQNVNVPCVFQVWKKTSEPRVKLELKKTTKYFDFTTPDKADLRIQRVGGNAGKAFADLYNSASSNYFIKNNTSLSNEDFIKFVNKLIFPTLSYTVGPKSLSKDELISVFEKELEQL